MRVLPLQGSSTWVEHSLNVSPAIWVDRWQGCLWWARSSRGVSKECSHWRNKGSCACFTLLQIVKRLPGTIDNVTSMLAGCTTPNRLISTANPSLIRSHAYFATTNGSKECVKRRGMGFWIRGGKTRGKVRERLRLRSISVSRHLFKSNRCNKQGLREAD